MIVFIQFLNSHCNNYDCFLFNLLHILYMMIEKRVAHADRSQEQSKDQSPAKQYIMVAKFVRDA